MTFLKCVTSVSIESTVSTRRRSCHYPQTVLPLATLTQFEIARIPLRGMEASVNQDNHALFTLPKQPLKGIVCDIGGVTRPRHDQSPLIEQQTQFPADNPPVIGEPFAADLLRTAALAHGVDQLDAVSVDAPEHGWSSSEDLRPALMGREETKEPRALG